MRILVGVEFALQKEIQFVVQVVVLRTMNLVEVEFGFVLQIMSFQQVFVQIMRKKVLLLFVLRIMILW